MIKYFVFKFNIIIFTFILNNYKINSSKIENNNVISTLENPKQSDIQVLDKTDNFNDIKDYKQTVECDLKYEFNDDGTNEITGFKFNFNFKCFSCVYPIIRILRLNQINKIKCKFWVKEERKSKNLDECNITNKEYYCKCCFSTIIKKI